jgi:hypothetical protein
VLQIVKQERKNRLARLDKNRWQSAGQIRIRQQGEALIDVCPYMRRRSMLSSSRQRR